MAKQLGPAGSRTPKMISVRQVAYEKKAIASAVMDEFA